MGEGTPSRLTQRPSQPRPHGSSRTYTVIHGENGSMGHGAASSSRHTPPKRVPGLGHRCLEGPQPLVPRKQLEEGAGREGGQRDPQRTEQTCPRTDGRGPHDSPKPEADSAQRFAKSIRMRTWVGGRQLNQRLWSEHLRADAPSLQAEAQEQAAEPGMTCAPKASASSPCFPERPTLRFSRPRESLVVKEEGGAGGAA